ncbi:BON domain-containing protein [Cupriavidus sp. H18C1]|uniref:BON domain-containing protein n=1 Tax=Cupriavidus sp. H18C1 TaxID=3241601 RepID=UPI003BB8BDA9
MTPTTIGAATPGRWAPAAAASASTNSASAARAEAGAWAAVRRHGAPRTLPKGYRRTDERICDEVCERLAEARDLDVSEVTVEVGSGIVTLSGTVSDRRAKYRVEDIAEEVMGVDEVRNNIRVPR